MAKAKYKKNKHGAFETKIWDGTYNKDGSKHRKLIRSTKSSRDLEEKVKEFEREVAENGTYKFSNITFAEYAQKWLEIRCAGKSPNTRKAYLQRLKCNFSIINDIPLCEIRHSHVAIMNTEWLEHPEAGRQALLVLRGVMDMAYSDGYIADKIYTTLLNGIKQPNQPKKEKRPLTPEEKAAIKIAEFDAMERAFISLLYSCGIRMGDALALSKFDFDFKSGTVTINKTWYDVGEGGQIKNSPKTARGFRTVPLSKDCSTNLQNYIKNLDGTQLFTYKNQLFSRSHYWDFWKRIVKKINQSIPEAKRFSNTPLTAHMFRHNYCSELCYQIPKISIKKIAQLMGDTQKMVMEVYDHILEEKEDAAAVVNDAFAL